MRYRTILPLLSVACVGGAWAAEPTPSYGPTPDWVEAITIPAPNPARKGAPFQFLTSTGQQRITANGSEVFGQYAIMAQTIVGLQVAGNVMLPWQADRYDLKLHWIDIIRNGKRIHQLRPDQVLVLRREENLEKAMLDGVRTVVMPMRGLQIGDVVDVAFSYRTKPNAVEMQPEDVFPAIYKVPLGLVDQRVLVDNSLKIKWSLPEKVEKPRERALGTMTEYRISRNNTAPVTVPGDAPTRFQNPLIHYTTYQQWGDVAAVLRPLFDRSVQLKPGSSLLTETKRIAASTSDPANRLMMALRLGQDQVRYVALLLAEGAYRPQSADDTWELRFGDCKGKTAMLLALLKELGIESEPLLVSARFDDLLKADMPSLALFDHVIVRARTGGKTYYLDPTDYGQRTLDEVAVTSFRHGLALKPGSTLETLPSGALSEPVKAVDIIWDRRGTADDAVPFTVRMTLRGWRAAEARGWYASATEPEKLEEKLKDLVPNLSNDVMKVDSIDADGPDGTFVVNLAGKTEMDWSPFEGEKATRYEFGDPIRWSRLFSREGEENKNLPYAIDGRPTWDRLTEVVLLPDGGRGFKLSAEPLEGKFAGIAVTRSGSLAGDRATMIVDFRQEPGEYTADEVKKAKTTIDDLSEKDAWIVGPKERKKKKS